MARALLRKACLNLICSSNGTSWVGGLKETMEFVKIEMTCPSAALQMFVGAKGYQSNERFCA